AAAARCVGDQRPAPRAEQLGQLFAVVAVEVDRRETTRCGGHASSVGRDRERSYGIHDGMLEGFRALLDGWPWFEGSGRYPIEAYSEFMPPPRLGRRAYGAVDPLLFDDGDPWGWNVTEYEEELELGPGLAHIASQVVDSRVHTSAGAA